MDPRRAVSPESALASDIFDKFCSANTLKAILSHYRHLCCTLRLKPTHFPDFYPRLTTKLSSWRAQGLWTKFEKRASHKCYNGGKACYGNRVLIIGAGPCGLRTAIEAQLLGAKVVVIEKRDRFSRNNVLHLWPFVIADLKALGAKKFYGKFCAGVEVLEGVGFEGLCEPAVNEGWRANVSPADHPVSHYDFDVLIGADGRRNTLEGFKRKALRAKLAIAITANFINKHTEAEARVKEISGVSYIFNQKFFQQLNEATGIDLENIVYYKDETHYFVMTAKKQSLLNKGVLLQDHSDTTKLLSHDNISSEALMIYALEAAIFSTDNQLLNLEFAVNHYGQPDVAMFDFTAMYAAENACRVVQRKGHKLLMSLVGDSLLEPFWPTGSGCARGFLSSFDACWMLRSWASGGKSILEVIAERESIYRLLGQTTPENLNKEHVGYAIDPYSRYPNLNVRVVLPFQVKSLLESDETDNVDFVGGVCKGHLLDAEKVLKKRRRDCVIAVDSLLSWVRDQVTCYGLEVIDVCDAFIRGDALCAIISRFRPDLIDFPLPSEENVDPLNTAASRNQIAFDLLHEEHGLSPIMSGFDSVQCTSSDFLTIVAYLSQIYEVFRGEIPQINYPRMENNEDIDDLDPQRYNHCGPKQHSSRPPLAARHFSGKFLNRRSRVSSSGRDGRIDGDNESSRKCKKRRGDDRSRGTTGREIKTSASHIVTNKQHVTGLTNKLEEKLKGSKLMEKKPKDLVKAIGKIEKVHWNVQFTDKKITESKTRCLNKKERDDKVPKWSREAFNNKVRIPSTWPARYLTMDKEDDNTKREAMQRKIEGCGSENGNHKLQQFQDQVKDLGIKLKEGNSREVGQRGSNKVSQMASQLVHKLEMPLNDHTVTKTSVQRSLFEFPNKGGSESCHFCDERVYVVERMTAEGKFFHRNCFRCEYCNTSLRLGNYVFDREGRYGERFYCTPHYGMVRLYGWKKYDLGGITTKAKFVRDRVSLLTPANLQILTVIDERGTTPERVEFENSVDFASEEELLSEMDEDEWTDRNFGVLNVGNNTSDEASDLSDDEDDITPEGNLPCKPSHCEDAVLANSKADNSDSDTEIASEDESGGNTSTNEEEDCEGEEEEGVEEGEDDCEGSTTEIDTDSEFADDPPYSVPGSIPTIVVDEPEQQVTRIIERTPLGHTHPRQTTKEIGHHCKLDAKPPQVLQPQIRQYRMDEPVKQTFSDRLLPRVNLVPKKWEPLPSLHDYQLASKLSLELKQKYLHGTLSNVTLEKKNVMDSAAQNQFRSVLDMISEKQKLLQPAAKPSATMQAFLDGAEKLKTKQKLSPISGAVCFTNSIENCSMNSLSSFRSCNIVNDQSWAQNNTVSKNDAGSLIEKNLKQNGGFSNMNRVNIEKNLELMGKNWNEDPEKCDFEKEILRKPIQGVPNVICTDRKNEAMPDSARIVVVPSDLLSFSHSEATDTPSTITGAHKNGTNKVIYPQTDQEKVKVQNQKEIKSNAVEDLDSESEEEGSGTESVHHLSESDDVDIEVDCIYATQKPPRVEIKDEFGVTFKVHECYDQNTETSINKTFCSSATSNEYLLENKDSNSIEISSSDSKDSLNSGVFLETEMSDWTRDGGGRGEQPQEGIKNKKKQNEVNKQSTSYIRHQHENDNSKKYSKLKASLTLELETIDFMDKDGESSPDDVAPQKKQGHCKLSNENVELEYRVNVSHYCYLLNNPCDKHFSGISSRESATTVGFQKSISEKAGSLTPKAIRQDNTVFASKAEQDFEKAVNPIMEKPIKSEQRPSFSSASPLGNNKYAILDRVVPFSNARDSLDNRKMKSIVSGSVNCKEILFPPYQACESIPRTVSICSSVISTNTNHTATADRQFDLENHNVLNSVLKNAVESTNIKTLDASNISHDGSDNQFYHRPLQLARAKSNSSYTDKSSNSPHIVRRIEEINNERTKQSDLIRSMVIGRLLKSPEKNRRNSKGSLSHLCAFNSSGSGSSEHFVPPSSAYQGEATESISCRNCQHSVISNLSAQDNNPAKNKNLVINRGLDCLKDPKKRDSADNVGLACLSSYWKGSESSRQEIELETQLKLKLSHASAQYEPVFTSSRFRNCPKFNSSLSIYSAVTNPPISVSPSPNILFRSTSDVFFSTKSFESRNRNKLPSFHRSMPDLSTFVKPSNVRSATSYTKEWEAYKSALIVDQKKVRQAARECARLKSDEDLRLSETDCTNKEKLRRKMSVPGDDVFDPNAAVVVSNVLSPAIPASCSDSSTSTKIIFENTRPISDMFDNVASSIRHNVDFPITKSIPFLAFPCHRSVAGSGSDAPLTGDLWLSETYDNKKRLLGLREIIKNDDFVHLRLRFNPKQNSPERIVSTDSARNVGQDKISELFPYYFKQASSDPLSFSSPQSNANSRIFKQEPKESRSNTPCDSYIRFSENHAGYSSSVNSLRASTSISPTAHNSTKSTVTKASPGPPKPKPSKYKAFSSVILVDEPHDLTPFGEAAGGTGVPNLIKDPCSENNQKNPKDRERLRSIIQAVSDFFSSRSLKNESSTNNSFSSTPNINQTAGTYLLSKEKFSLFKSTPKLLHKDRGVSKSRESLFPTLPASGCESLKDRSKFASYLSHPNKVIKMLSSSPTHLTPSRANLDSGRYSVATTSHSALDVSSAISPSFVTRRDSLVSTSQKSSRLQEVQAARLQLESIEVELTKLKTLRTSIQENLKSKESGHFPPGHYPPGSFPPISYRGHFPPSIKITTKMNNENREDAEFVEEEATLVKEKKPLARLESDLVLKAQQLQIEELKGHAQENLDNENSYSIQNMKDLKMREILVITELHSLEKLKGNLLSKYKDIQNYKAEVAKLESKIASCCVSPQESNV